MRTVTINKSLDHGWAWVILAGCFGIFFLIQGIDKCMGLIYLELLERLHEKASTTAWVIATATAGRLLIAPFTSALCKKYGCRIITIIGGSIASMGLFLGAFSFNMPYEFFAIGICYGLGSGLYFPSTLIMTVQYFDKRLGMAACLSASGGGLGIMLFPFLFNVFMNTFGFPGTLFLLSAINLHVVVIGALFKPPTIITMERCSNAAMLSVDTKFSDLDLGGDTVENGGSKSDTLVPSTENQLLPVIVVGNGEAHQDEIEREMCPGETSKGKNGGVLPEQNSSARHASRDESRDPCIQIRERRRASEIKTTENYDETRKRRFCCCKEKPGFLPNVSLMRHPGYLLYMAQTMLVGFAQLSFVTFFAALAEERGASHSDAALLLTISGVVDIPAKLTTGFLVDLRRIRPHRRHVLTATIFVNAIVIAVTPMTSAFSELAAVGLTLGLIQGVYFSHLLVVMIDIVGRERQADAIGLSMFSRSVSMLCGPSVIGYIKDVTKSYSPSFYMCGAAGVLAGLAFLLQFFFFPVPPPKGDTTIVSEEEEEEENKNQLNIQSNLAVSSLSIS